MSTAQPLYPCPACGFLQFSGPPGTYEICDICGWEDDHVQLARPLLRGGANRICLFEAQQLALHSHPVGVDRFGSAERDPQWRPLTKDEASQIDATVQSGMDYFGAAAADSPVYYWTRSKT
jgi:hypothetical protein